MGGRGAMFGFYLIAGASACPAASAADDQFDFAETHMGTTVRVVLYAPDKPTATAAAKTAFARVAALDAALSDYKKESELNRLCRAFATAVGDPVPVGDDLFTVLRKGQSLSEKSAGAFDVTVGPVVALWRIARRTQELPDPKELAAARAKVGYRNVRLDPAKRTVQLLVPGIRLDLGGIGKGYAADAALKVMREKHGVTRALVAASGDIACGDPPPGADAWDVKIAPITKGQEQRSLRLANAAVSTSGDLEQYVEIGGVRYSHVLDPRTGLGLTGRRSVTVVAPDGTTADSMTKAVSVLPPADGLALVEAVPGAAAYVVVLGPDGKPAATASERFGRYAAPVGKP